MTTMAAAASPIKTAPYDVNDWYGYTHVSYSISVSNQSTTATVSQIAFNTLTASGAWTATKSYLNNFFPKVKKGGFMIIDYYKFSPC